MVNNLRSFERSELERKSNFKLYYCSKKFQILRKKVMLLLEQLQVCIFAEIVFGVRCTLNYKSLYGKTTV